MDGRNDSYGRNWCADWFSGNIFRQINGSRMMWHFATTLSQEAPSVLVFTSRFLCVTRLSVEELERFVGKLSAGIELVITLSTCHGRLPNPPLSSFVVSNFFADCKTAHGVLPETARHFSRLANLRFEGWLITKPSSENYIGGRFTYSFTLGSRKSDQVLTA
jgi:hypothetical protein